MMFKMDSCEKQPTPSTGKEPTLKSVPNYFSLSDAAYKQLGGVAGSTTIRQYIRNNWVEFSQKQVPYLSPENIQERLKFSQQMQDKNFHLVLVGDEKLFKVSAD